MEQRALLLTFGKYQWRENVAIAVPQGKFASELCVGVLKSLEETPVGFHATSKLGDWLYSHVFNLGSLSYIQKSLSPFLEVYPLQQAPGSQKVLIWQMDCRDLGW